MIRIFVITAVLSVACKLFFGRWPWEFAFQKGTREEALSQARRLLGVRPGASRKDIIDAHKRLIATVHPDRGGTNAQVHEANAARDLLIDDLPQLL